MLHEKGSKPAICLQTLSPFQKTTKPRIPIRLEAGLGEWYGRARFDHPSPAPFATIARFFPNSLDENWTSRIIPSKNGETVEELHDRIAYALSAVIAAEDDEEKGRGMGEERAILICTHAASMIAIGRTLTGAMPEDVATDDFGTFTAGISKFTRRHPPNRREQVPLETWEPGKAIPKLGWRNGKGVAGGWDCEINCDCSHLSRGAERGWHFQGDEAFEDESTIAAAGERGNDSDTKYSAEAKL